MNRRQFSRAVVVGLPIVSMMAVIGIDGQWNKSEAQRVGRLLRRRLYRNREVEIEEGGELDTLGVVRARIRGAVVGGRRKIRDIQLSKSIRNNRPVYTTGYFPFGEEFPTADAALEDIIDLGVLDLD